jgi:hypothetical protein
MIEIDLSEEELFDSIQAVEDGVFSAKECFTNILLFQSKNKKCRLRESGKNTSPKNSYSEDSSKHNTGEDKVLEGLTNSSSKSSPVHSVWVNCLNCNTRYHETKPNDVCPKCGMHSSQLPEEYKSSSVKNPKVLGNNLSEGMILSLCGEEGLKEYRKKSSLASKKCNHDFTGDASIYLKCKHRHCKFCGVCQSINDCDYSKRCTCKNTESDKDDGLCIYCGGKLK